MLMACSTAPVATPSTAGPTTSEPVSSSAPLPTAARPSALTGETAFDQVIAMLGPDGEVSSEMALQAFALAIAPIPGVTPPSGSNPSPNADAALEWILGTWDELSSAQRTAVQTALDALPDPFIDDATSADISGASVSLAAWHQQTGAAEWNCISSRDDPASYTGLSAAVVPYWKMAADASAAITRHLRRATVSELGVCLVSGAEMAGRVLTSVFDAQGERLGIPQHCVIYVNLDADIDPGDLGYIMAGGTFGCFKPTADPNEPLKEYYGRVIAPWVRGGSSAWVAATIAEELFGGPGDGAGKPWSEYLTEPGESLFRRVDSAIGFMAQVDQDQPSAWDVIDRMLLAADPLAALYVATGTRQSFIRRWAAGYFRDASRGPDWDILGPGIPTDTAEAGSIEVANGETQGMAAPAFAVSIADLSTSADITTFASTHLRIHDGVQDLPYVPSQAYCTREGGPDACACPTGTPGAGRPSLPALNAEAKLAVTGWEFGATAEIRGISLEEYCGPPTGDGATWHLNSPASYSGGPSHVVVDAYTCASISGPWKATMHVTHDPAVPGDPPLDRTVEFSWSFDSSGTAQPTIGPYEDTVFGRTHTLVYYPLLHLNADSGTVTVVRLDASEDGSPRVDATYQLERAGEPVPLDPGRPSGC